MEDVLRTLHESMASKVVALLEKAQHPVQAMLLIGGLRRIAPWLPHWKASCRGPDTDAAGKPVF